MDSKTYRMYQVIQPGLTTMGVPDPASQVAARILTEAQEMAQAKVDAAQRQLTLAQEEMAGVRALVRAAAGEGATARTDARLLGQLQQSKSAPHVPHTTLTVKTDEQGRKHATSPSGRHDPALCSICLEPAQPKEEKCSRILGHERHGWTNGDNEQVTCPGFLTVPAGPDRFA